MRVFYSFAFALVFASLGLACVDSPAVGTVDVASPAAHSGPETALSVCRPTLLVVQRDRSGSALNTATPPITREHLATFVEVVRDCGGELAVGDICSRSFVPLTRLRIEEPPASPMEPAWSPNPYLQQQQLAAFQPVKQAFQDALASRAAAIDAETAAFSEAAWPRLSSAPSCRASDVAGAVERGLLFLQEPAEGWSREPRRVIALVSDAQHNTSPWKVTLPEDVEMLLINGIGSRGAFAGAPGVQLFESLAGATRYLRLSQ